MKRVPRLTARVVVVAAAADVADTAAAVAVVATADAPVVVAAAGAGANRDHDNLRKKGRYGAPFLHCFLLPLTDQSRGLSSAVSVIRDCAECSGRLMRNASFSRPRRKLRNRSGRLRD